MTEQVTKPETADSAYHGLCRLGGAAALIVVVLILGEVIAQAVSPLPGTVSEWFTLFRNNPTVGLVDFWGLEVLMYIMFALVYLTLYVLLRRANETRMAIAVTFALLGIGIFLATNSPFSMLSLSNQHAAATTDVQRSTFLAAGQALLANTGQRAVGGFNTGLFLVSIAGLIVSSVMFQSSAFSRLTAYVGVLAFALSLADYLRQVFTTSPIVALLLILPGALFLVIWYALVGRRLYHLGHPNKKTVPKQW